MDDELQKFMSEVRARLSLIESHLGLSMDAPKATKPIPENMKAYPSSTDRLIDQMFAAPNGPARQMARETARENLRKGIV